MCCISKRIKDCIEFLIDSRVAWPYIGCRNYQILSKRTVSVYANALCIFTVLLVSFQTVTAFAAGDMSFTGYQIARFESLYTGSDFYNFAYILVSGCKSDRDRVLCPVIPLINVYVRTTNCIFVDLDLHIIWSNLRDRYSLHPKSLFWFFFHQCPHHIIIHVFNLRA